MNNFIVASRILCIVLLAGSIWAFISTQHELDFSRHCVRTAAEISGASYTINNRTGEKTYTVRYTYQVQGVSHYGQGDTPANPEGITSIDIYYDPSNPDVSAMDATGWIMPAMLSAFLLVLGLIFSVSFFKES
jgi:hypothetical protein